MPRSLIQKQFLSFLVLGAYRLRINQDSLLWKWKTLQRRALEELKRVVNLKDLVLYKVRTPPEAPSESEASQQKVLLKEILLTRSLFILVSCNISKSGLWSLIIFLMSSYLWAPLRPLMFHEITFISYFLRNPWWTSGVHLPGSFLFLLAESD